MINEETFVVLPEHVLLLRRAYVRWNDNFYTGSPEIDPKRPYGSSSVKTDIAEIIEPERLREFDDEDEQDGYIQSQGRRLMKIHRGTGTALQIFLHTGQFKPGKYRCDLYGRDWEYVGPADG